MKNLNFSNYLKPVYFIAVLLFITINFVSAQYPAGSPVAVNGKLKVTGTQLTNECGNPVQLRGMSTHGVQWFPGCYTASSLDALVNNWGIDVFRLAMYVQEGGYVNNPSYWKTWIDNMVTECGNRGIYCLIDWHMLNPGDPNANITEARDFWSYMSAKHAGKKHVLYEICNEPNGVSWSAVKTYANDIIPRIRINDAATIIIVGTPTWSQDVDVASTDKLSYTNIMYALHFYSGTHTGYLRDKANAALANGAPLFVTECGTSTASGDGGPYLTEMQTWIDWMAANKISWINWNFADKSETSSALTPGACAASNWNSTSASGTFIKQKLLSPADNFVCGNVNTPPVVSVTSPANGAAYTAPAAITLNATASDADGTVSAVSFYNGNTLLGTDNTSPYSYSWSNVAAGSYSVTVRATDNGGAITTSAPVSVTVTGTAAASIPGKIEAENWSAMSGVQTETTIDAGGGLNAGWIDTGDWMDYNVNVSSAGSYNVSFRVASQPGGGQLQLRSGTSILSTVNIAATGGWQSWITLNATINLPAGNQTLRLYAAAGGYNVNWVSYAAATSSNTPPTVNITSPSNGTSYSAPANIIINASAADINGTVSSVAFFNGSTLLGTDNTSPFTFTWSGAGAGTYSITARATDNEGASTTSAAVSITVTGGTITTGLKLQYKTTDASTSTNTLRPLLQIVNTGSAGIPLSELKIRYWYTKDGTASQNFYCDWSAMGCSNIRATFVTLPGTISGANNYLELSFYSGTLAANSSSGEIQDRIAKSDWTNFTQSDDYSFDATKSSFADWDKVTLYRNGVLVWGTEPSGYTAAKFINQANASIPITENIVETREKTLKTGELFISPNPSRSYTNMYYSSAIPQKVTILVSGVTAVKHLEANQIMQRGLNNVSLNLSALLPGTYFVTIVPLTGKPAVKKVVVK